MVARGDYEYRRVLFWISCDEKIIMPLTKLQFQPGINRNITSYGAEGGWYSSDKIRFRSGMPEKIGGWGKYQDTTTDLTGTPRGIIAWKTHSGDITVGVGTNSKVYIEQGNVWTDITPIDMTNTLNGAIATTNGSGTVTITDTGHTRDIGDYVTISGATAFNGLTTGELNQEFVIATVPTADTYTVATGGTANATGSGGGASISAAYQIKVGLEDSTVGLGFGAGAWNAGTWGTARTSGTILASRFWYFSLWGEDLIMCHNYGKIFTWDASQGVTVRATLIHSTAPSMNNMAIVSAPDRHLVALGAHDGTAHNPLLVKWCSQEDYTDWSPSATDTAGSQLLTGGSTIVGATQTEGQILIWTDTDMHSMQYIGPPYTFGFQKIGSNCAIVSSRAFAHFNGATFWMGLRNFWVYDGSLQILPSSVNQYIFDDIDLVNAPKIHAATNTEFNEITWFYASEDDNTNKEINRYVTYNVLEQSWAIGTFDRTVWEDRGVLKYPLAIDSGGQPYSHEKTVNGDGSAITAYIESGEFDIGEGDRLMFINRIIPDFTMSGNLDITLKTRRYPNGSQATDSFTGVTSSTEKLDTRVRGRQAALRIESNDTDDNWRYGAVRLEMKPDGRQ